MAVIVVDETEFGIIKLAGPLDGLFHITCRGYLPIGGVGIGGANIAGGAVEFANVLRQIPAVGEPGAVLLESQRAGGHGLSRVPGDIPERRVVAAGEVDTSDLQIAAVDVALLKRDIVAYGDHLRGAEAHVVVLAMHGGDGAVCRLAGEDRGAVFGIVADGPDAGAGLHAALVAVGIVLRDEVGDIIHREHGVLVECIGLVAGDFLRILLQEGKTTNHHHLSGDGASGRCTVLHSFRSFIIDTPLHGSQATFANKHRFRLQRGAQLRDKLLLRTAQRLTSGIVASGSGDAIYTTRR